MLNQVKRQRRSHDLRLYDFEKLLSTSKPFRSLHDRYLNYHDKNISENYGFMDYLLAFHWNYINEPTVIRTIVTYADKLGNSDETESLFWYLYHKKIGFETACFWVSWAFITEKFFDYRLTHSIYLKAIEIRAQPKDIILQRYRGFQQRVKYYGIEVGENKAFGVFDYPQDILSREDCKRNNDHHSQVSKLIDSQSKGHLSVDNNQDGSNSSFQNIEVSTRTPTSLLLDNHKNFTIHEDVGLNHGDSSNASTSLRRKIALHTNERVRNHVSLDTNSERPKSAFDPSKTRQTLIREEKCFEERRAERGYFTLEETSFSAQAMWTSFRESSDYISLYKENITNALIRMTQKASMQLNGKYLNSNIRNRKTWKLPRKLLRDCKHEVRVNVAGDEILVLNKLGSGVYGTVILCSISPFKDFFAMKIQRDPQSLAWEYEILEKIQSRISTRDVHFPLPLNFSLFSDGATMNITAASDHGLNLVDIVNIHGGSVPELLAIHYTSRMLTCLRSLHFDCNVLHCDIKPDNWVLISKSQTMDSDNRSDIMLVDFGRAVDIMERGGKGLYGNIAAEDLECVSMRCGQTWSYDIDTYGVCVCAHTLLHGSYLDIIPERNGENWQPVTNLRRYWQKELWETLFDFVNMRAPVNRNDYFQSLNHTIKLFDTYLRNKKIKSDLVSILERQERMLPKIKFCIKESDGQLDHRP